MKKVKKSFAALLTSVLIAGTMAGCGDKDKGEAANNQINSGYQATSGFYYSSDKGHTYGDGTKEYEIGDTVYMKVRFKVISDEDDISQIKVVLTIPQIDSVDAKYMDGQIITPNPDPVNNVTTYEFTANASKTATDQECVIQFIPNAVGEVRMTLVFDDNVDASYDKQSTLIFVKDTGDKSEGEE